MQITTKARYAITAMLDLASNENNKPINLGVISKRQNISLSYLGQIFAKLRRQNLVRSVRGPGGGYLLNNPMNEISINNIIEAIDENIDLSKCGGLGNCSNGKKCISHNLWCEVSEQIRDFLINKTLGQVIIDYKRKG